jgi:hypothetical protein
LSHPGANRAKRELTAEQVLEALPEEARDTFADLAGVPRGRAERTVQLLGVGSRTALLTLGLVKEENEQEGEGCRLTLTDQAFPVMLAAALSRCGLPSNVDPEHILSQADAALARIEARAGEAEEGELQPISLPVRAGMDSSALKTLVVKIRLASDVLRGSPAKAGSLYGVVSRVVSGQEPYTVIDVYPAGEGQMTQFLSYSRNDRAGNELSEGEEVRFLPAAAGRGDPVAVDVQLVRSPEH